MVLPASAAFSQYTEDILRFSRTEQGSTARFRALGNAQTALGGDLSSLNSNPAGIGLFTRSEFTFSPDFLSNKADAKYIETGSSVQKDKLGISQVGLLFHSPSRRLKGQDLDKGWLSVNFGASYNKNSNFNSTVSYGAVNPRSSFADFIADRSNFYLGNGDPANNSSALPRGWEDMAYSNYQTEYSPGGYFATTSVNNNQRNITYTTGNQSDVNLGLAANYSNQLYIGLSVGLSSLKYDSDRTFTEAGANREFDDQDPNFIGGSYRSDYRSYQQTDGSGINVKLGLIYRPTPIVRFGFSFISPTWYSLSDSYSEGLTTAYTRSNGTAILPAYTNSDATYNLEYNLRTPYKVNGGLAIIVSKIGLLTADVEYVDYSSMHFSSSGDIDTENNTNADIRELYQGALNLKLGAEVKLSSPLFLRAGVNRNGNPYNNIDYNLTTYSAGLGYRMSSFYVDLTYTGTTDKYNTMPYSISTTYPDFDFTGPGDNAQIKNKRNNIYATVGFRF